MFDRLALMAGLLLTLVLASYAAIVQSEGAEIDIQFPAPDQIVLDQDGKHLNFYTDLVKGKTVAINFIFTACTSSCPLSSAIFRQVQKKLGKQKVQLITISVDPVNDTPERLLEFSKKFKAGPGWEFITGESQLISELLKNLGAYAGEKNNHSNMVIIGDDANHRWTRLYGFPQADEIISVLKYITSASKNK
jgi:protein SCO1